MWSVGVRSASSSFGVSLAPFDEGKDTKPDHPGINAVCVELPAL
jgi:hypothetical protein